MKQRIIVDSCCDLTPEMKAEMGIVSVPLSMILGETEYRDDAALDIPDFLAAMKQFKGKAGSAAPAPFLYQEALAQTEDAYVVTLSKKLSASYDNAVMGNEDAESGKAACIFDSKSAAAGETLIAIKVHELILAGITKDKLIESVKRFIDGMKTYFVLENLDNLQKNGRLGKVKGTLAQLLNIKLILGADGNGEIALFEKCRGVSSVVKQLLSLIENSGRSTHNENLVISHCNNPSLAAQIADLIKERFQFKQVVVVPTGGLSSLYADQGGIIMAF